jgi:hypothetical protein
VVYRPPGAIRENDEFLELLQEMLLNTETIIFGDFNIDLLKMNSLGRDYRNTLAASGYYVINQIEQKFATRIAEVTNSKKIIDHGVSNMYNLKGEMFYIDNDISDHRILLLNINNNKQITQETDKLKIIDYNQLQSSLHREPIAVNNKEKPSNMYSKFQDQLCMRIQKYTKIIEIKKTENYMKDWMNEEVIQKVKEKNKYFALKRKFPDNERYKNKYKSLSNQLTTLKRERKAEYFKNKCKNLKNIRELWGTVNEILYNKRVKPKSRSEINKIVNNITKQHMTDKKEIVNYINDYFCDVGEMLARKLGTTKDLGTVFINHNSTFNFYKTNENEIIKIINDLNSNSAAGIDGISVKILQKCKLELAKPITAIMNKIIDTGEYPGELKVAKVVPIFKGGDRKEAGNYRPISILSVIAKIFDKIVDDRLMKFLKQNSFLSECQYAFTENSSTEAAVYNVINRVQMHLDKKQGNKAGMLFIDLRKAFDSVKISNLLDKLSYLGIRGKYFKFFVSYLTGRKQRVMLDAETRSKDKFLKFGIQQGGTTSPKLFILYINDIAKLKLRGKLTIYADDICLVYEDDDEENIVKNMQYDLELLQRWFTVNSLSLNIEKTKYMIISTGEKISTILKPKVNSKIIEQVFVYKYLGLLIDYKLKFHEHINHVKNKIAPIIGVLWRTKHIMPDNVKNHVYNAFVNSHLNYLVGVWGNAYENELKSVKTMQNKTLKIMFNFEKRKNTVELYKETQKLNLKSMNCVALNILMYKVSNNMIQNDFEIQYNSDVHRYNTRQAIDIHIDFTRTNLGKMGILTKAAHLYNDLPTELRELTSISVFKKQIRDYWFNKQGN